MAEDKKDCDEQEFVVVGPQIADGVILGVHHGKNHEASHVILKSMEAGCDYSSNDIVSLSPREDRRGMDVEYIHRAGGSGSDITAKPSMVNSKAYRDNWDAVFGKSQEKVLN